VRHEFKLGSNAFMLGRIDDAGLQRAYEDRFAALLTFATLPFYWGGYEPRMNERPEDRLDAMAAWCAAKGIVAKGHPLAWHEVFPDWAKDLSDDEALARLQARVRQIVERFAGRIDMWDVVNEATVSHRFENAVGRWMAGEGAAQCVDQALQWAHEANPRAALLYNDFNVSDDFEALVSSLVGKRAPVHTIGIQSHMHKDVWPLEKAWRACESYSRFGMPLHFTELTILSGRLKATEDNDWHKQHDDWISTLEGEARQLEYGSALYTLLFSHPAVEAITCWDFSDRGAW
jgi:endo-1,4-beta-xylanase